MDWSTFDERFEWSMAIQNQDVFLGFQYKVEATKYSLFFFFVFNSSFCLLLCLEFFCAHTTPHHLYLRTHTHTHTHIASSSLSSSLSSSSEEEYIVFGRRRL